MNHTSPQYLHQTAAGGTNTIYAGRDAVGFIRAHLEKLVGEGLERCLEEHPEDAVHFLAEHLKANNPSRQRQQRTLACEVVTQLPQAAYPSYFSNNEASGLLPNDSLMSPTTVVSESISLSKSPTPEPVVEKRERIEVNLEYVSRSNVAKAPKFTMLGQHPVFTTFAPSKSDLDALLASIAEYVADDAPDESGLMSLSSTAGPDIAPHQPATRKGSFFRRPPGKSYEEQDMALPIEVFLLQNNEVIYIEDRPFVGDLTATMSHRRNEGTATAPLNVQDAAEVVLEGALNDDTVKSCASVADVFTESAQRNSLDVNISLHPVSYYPAAASFAEVRDIAEMVEHIAGEKGSLLGFGDQSAPPRVTVIVAFEPAMERVLAPFSMIPTIAHHCDAEFTKITRLQRSAAEMRALEAMKQMKMHALGGSTEMTATARVVHDHERLVKRRAERKERRKLRSEELALHEREDFDRIESVEARRASRHQAEAEEYRRSIEKVQQVAATRIQALARGYLTRGKHIVTPSSATSERNVVFETTFAQTKVGLNPLSPDAVGGDALAGTASASPLGGTGQLDGDFALLRQVVHRVVEVDDTLFTLERPVKPRPPRVYTVVKQRTRRVPPTYDGDISSEEEEIEHVEVGTKPQPLTRRQLEVNPIFALQRCMEKAHCEDVLEFAQEAVQYRGVHAVQARAFRAVEQMCVWTLLISYLNLAQRQQLDHKEERFDHWVAKHFNKIVTLFGHPQLFSEATTSGIVAYTDPNGPADVDASSSLVIPKQPQMTSSGNSYVPGTTLQRLGEGLFYTNAPLSMTEWRSTLASLHQDERPSTVTWSHSTRHPTIYVGETMYLSCSVPHETARQQNGVNPIGGKAPQMCNGTIVHNKNMAKQLPKSLPPLEERSLETEEAPTMSPHPPAHPQRQRGSQPQAAILTPQQPSMAPPPPTEHVGFAPQATLTAEDVVQHVDPMFPQSTSIMSIDWMEWETRLKDAAIAKIEAADGMLSAYVWKRKNETARFETLEKEERRVVKSKAKKEHNGPLGSRIARNFSNASNTSSALAAQRRESTGSNQSMISVTSVIKSPSNSNGTKEGTFNRRRTMARKSTRGTRANRGSKQSESSRSLGSVEQQGTSFNLYSENDPNNLLPESAKRTVKTFATAASEIIADQVRPPQCGTPPPNSLAEDSILTPKNGDRAQFTKMQYMRAPLMALSPQVLYGMMEAVSRITRDTFSSVMASINGDSPALVLSLPNMDSTTTREDALFVATAVVVHQILKPVYEPRPPQSSNNLTNLLRAPGGGSDPSQSRGTNSFRSSHRSSLSIRSNPPITTSVPTTTSASQQQEITNDISLGVTVTNVTSMQYTVTEKEEEGDRRISTYSMKAPAERQSPSGSTSLRSPRAGAATTFVGEETPEEPASVLVMPGVQHLLGIMETSDMVYDELIPRPHHQSSSDSRTPAEDLAAWVDELIAQLPQNMSCFLSPKSVFMNASLASMTGSAAPQQRLKAAVDAAASCEQYMLLILFAAFYSSPVTCSFEEFIETNHDLATFMEEFDVFDAIGVEVDPAFKRFACRLNRWRCYSEPSMFVL